MWYSYKWIWERGFFCLFFSILLRWENLGLRVREVAFKTKNDLFMELISAGNIWQMCPDKSCSKENRSWSTSVIYSQPKARLFTHFVKLVSYKADLVQALMAEVCDAIADYIFMIWGDGILMLPPKKKKKTFGQHLFLDLCSSATYHTFIIFIRRPGLFFILRAWWIVDLHQWLSVTADVGEIRSTPGRLFRAGTEGPLSHSASVSTAVAWLGETQIFDEFPQHAPH